jgi:hypothetical protein
VNLLRGLLNLIYGLILIEWNMISILVLWMTVMGILNIALLWLILAVLLDQKVKDLVLLWESLYA